MLAPLRRCGPCGTPDLRRRPWTRVETQKHHDRACPTLATRRKASNDGARRPQGGRSLGSAGRQEAVGRLRGESGTASLGYSEVCRPTDKPRSLALRLAADCKDATRVTRAPGMPLENKAHPWSTSLDSANGRPLLPSRPPWRRVAQTRDSRARPACHNLQDE